MKRYALTIPGKPFAKQRPRFSRASGRAFTPSETVAFERTVGIIARQHIAEPITGPVRVSIIATFAPPPSWSKKRRDAVLTTPHAPHTQKPDADNCQKAVLDGLNRIAFADDAQVSDISCRKCWGVHEGTTVFIEELA